MTESKTQKLIKLFKLIEETAKYDPDGEPDHQVLYDVIDECRGLAKKCLDTIDQVEFLKESLLETIRTYESITVSVWGNIHERPEEFKGSVGHFVWDSSETILMALMVAEIDGWAFPMIDKENSTLYPFLNLNDTFYYASADGERISFVDFWKLFVRKYRGDKYADVKFVEERRKQKALEKYHQEMLDFYKENPEMEGPMPLTLLDYDQEKE